MTEEHCWGHYGEKDRCERFKYFCEDERKCFVYTKKLHSSVTKVKNDE